VLLFSLAKKVAKKATAQVPRGLPLMAERLFGLLPALCTSSSMSVAQRGGFTPVTDNHQANNNYKHHQSSVTSASVDQQFRARIIILMASPTRPSLPRYGLQKIVAKILL